MRENLSASKSDNDTNAVLRAKHALNAALETFGQVELGPWLSIQDDGFSMNRNSLCFLARVIQELQPGHILEFGSGISTRVMAWSALDLNAVCRITSIDHDPVYARRAMDALEALRLNESVRVQAAPLVLRQCGNILRPVYSIDPAAVASEQPADFILIDGPPNLLGGREGVLHQAMDFSRSGTIILLDDADRAEERSALSSWQMRLLDAVEIQFLSGFERGLAAAFVRQPVPRDQIEDHWKQRIVEEICSFVPAGASLILVDQNQLAGAPLPDRRRLPFLERNGKYWGTPEDDASAVEELERLRHHGAQFIVFIPSTFWWLDFYDDFGEHLLHEFNRCRHNNVVIAFDLNK